MKRLKIMNENCILLNDWGVVGLNVRLSMFPCELFVILFESIFLLNFVSWG